MIKLVHLICCRNWRWDEPSCNTEMCVVLYNPASAPPDKGHFLFQWNDDNCNSKNNFVCKYREGEPEALYLAVLGIIDIWHCVEFAAVAQEGWP